MLLRAGHGVRVELQSLDGQLTDAADAGSRVDLERLGQAGVTDVDQVRVIADIHLHTGSGVRQSHTDAAHPMVARAGHLALIAPQFGRGVTRVDQLGAHLKGAQGWHTFLESEVAEVLGRSPDLARPTHAAHILPATHHTSDLNVSTLDPEHISRTSLLFMRQAGDAAVGAERHRAFALRIVASTKTCSQREGQAAVITAVKTAVRALSFDDGDSTSRVTVALASPEQPVLGGPSAGIAIGEVVQQEGAGLTTDCEVDPATLKVILGQAPAEIAQETGATIATWTGW